MATIFQSEDKRLRLKHENYDYSNIDFLKKVVLIFHIIGLSGIALYIYDFSKELGGIEGFFFNLQYSSYEIRGAAVENSSVGTQISYFGWIANGVTVSILSQLKGRTRGIFIFLFIAELCGNILYIDRTRPLFIILTSVFCFFYQYRPNIKQAILTFSTLIPMIILIFVTIGNWVGKTVDVNKYDSPLPPYLEGPYFYLTSGFGYFNEILKNNAETDYTFSRTLYVLWKAIAPLKLFKEPPIPILEFYDTPYTTNVGTFLEPFFRDGGIVYVLIGTLIHSFVLNRIAIGLLSRNNPFATYAWSAICYCSVMSCFTPFVLSFPIWLMIAVGFILGRKQFKGRGSYH